MFPISGGRQPVSQYPPKIQTIHDEILQRLHETYRHLIAPETTCVHDAANSGDTELLRLFLIHIDSGFSLRFIRDACREVRILGSEPAIEIITDHGLEMRNLVAMEMAGEYPRDVIEPIYVMSMKLTEPEVRRVLEIVRRGVLDVKEIHGLLAVSADVAQPLIDGIL